MKVEDLVEQIIDYRGKTPPKVSSGIPLITAKVIKGGRILPTREFITEDVYTAWMRRGFPQQWDLLVTTEAPLGEIALLRTAERIALAQRVILLRGNGKLIDQRYLAYVFESPLVQDQLRARATGTTVQGIKQSELRQVDIPVLPLEVQQKIAAVLAAYDELIENNLRRIEILEEMAQAVYREWFVNFHYPGHENVPLVNSSLGPIPEGWDVMSFSEVADFVNGFAFKPVHLGDRGLPIVKIKELKNGVTAGTPRNSGHDIPEKFHIEQGELLFSWSADLVVQLWAYGSALLNQHLFRVLPKTDGANVDYLVHALRHRLPEFKARAQGTTMRHIKRSALTEVKVARPSAELLHEFTDRVRPMHLLVRNLVRQNINLRTTRDLLLPKFVSGAIDVSDLDIDTEWLAL